MYSVGLGGTWEQSESLRKSACEKTLQRIRENSEVAGTLFYLTSICNQLESDEWGVAAELIRILQLPFGCSDCYNELRQRVRACVDSGRHALNEGNEFGQRMGTAIRRILDAQGGMDRRTLLLCVPLPEDRHPHH